MENEFKKMNNSEKPREKLVKLGAKSLLDFELLAIIIRTGTKDKNVIELSKELLKELNSFAYCQELTIEELVRFKGIGKTKAIELLAIFEFSSRILMKKNDNIKIESSKECYGYLKNRLTNLSQEHLVAIYLSSTNKIVFEKVISIGSMNKTIGNYKDVIKLGLKVSAFAVIVAHNHPGGDPTPSQADYNFTRQLIEACNAVDLFFVDHLIICNNCYYSFNSNKNI